MKIFIDDLRMKPEIFDLKFESGEMLLSWMKENPNTQIDLLSLDHDLNEGFMDGTKLCREIVELDPNIRRVQFHSDNFDGLKNMYSIISSATRSGALTHVRSINPYKINVIDGEMSEMRYFDLRRNT